MPGRVARLVALGLGGDTTQPEMGERRRAVVLALQVKGGQGSIMSDVTTFAWQALSDTLGFGLSVLVLLMAAWGAVTLIGFIRYEVRGWR